MHFAPSKRRVFFQDWEEHVLAPTVCGDRMEVVSSVRYLGSLITPGGIIVEKITLGISKAKAALATITVPPYLVLPQGKGVQ